MKRKSLMVCCIFITVLFSFCKKENNIQEQDNVVTKIQLSLTEADYNQIGINHNLELEKAFKALKLARSKGELENQEYFNIIKESSLSSYKFESSKEYDIRIDEMKKKIERYQAVFQEYAKTYKKGNTNLSPDMLKGPEDLMTDTQKEITSQITKILLDKSSSLAVIQVKLDSLETVVKLTCNDNEMPSLLAGISVARHSSKYWHDNYSKWQSELGFSSSKEEDPLTWKFVAIFDICAAIFEGIAASPALCVPWVGWGFYLSAVGIFTTIASAMATVTMLIVNEIAAQ